MFWVYIIFVSFFLNIKTKDGSILHGSAPWKCNHGGDPPRPSLFFPLCTHVVTILSRAQTALLSGQEACRTEWAGSRPCPEGAHSLDAAVGKKTDNDESDKTLKTEKNREARAREDRQESGRETGGVGMLGIRTIGQGV